MFYQVITNMLTVHLLADFKKHNRRKIDERGIKPQKFLSTYLRVMIIQRQTISCRSSIKTISNFNFAVFI